jgi:hypothetical protein
MISEPHSRHVEMDDVDILLLFSIDEDEVLLGSTNVNCLTIDRVKTGMKDEPNE